MYGVVAFIAAVAPQRGLSINEESAVMFQHWSIPRAAASHVFLAIFASWREMVLPLSWLRFRPKQGQRGSRQRTSCRSHAKTQRRKESLV